MKVSHTLESGQNSLEWLPQVRIHLMKVKESTQSLFGKTRQLLYDIN